MEFFVTEKQFPFPKLLGRFVGYNLSLSTPFIEYKYRKRSINFPYFNKLSIAFLAICILFFKLPETIIYGLL